MLMACNTMHLYVERFYDTDASIHHISLIDTMSRYLVWQSQTRVGILWSINTIRNELYHKALRESHIIPISLDDADILRWVNNIIVRVISGEQLDASDTCIMKRAIESLVDKWAECIILGCTELPIAFAGFDSPVPLYDPLLVSVREACRQYYSPTRDSLYS
jgi:aspartate racemase